MRRRASSLASLTLVLAACGGRGEPAADLVLRGGVVRTMDAGVPAGSAPSAVAVRAGRIVYVGDDAGVAALVGDATEVIELSGRAVLPGFHDTHVHPISGGLEQAECDLTGVTTRADVVRLVAACAAADPTAPWVRGGGFALPIFPGGAPTRELLDSLVPDRPAYLTSADAHTAWVNSPALTLAGVTASTPDPPPDGVIVRGADGSPQGTLRESAMGLVARHLPAHSPAELRAGLERSLALAASYGITTLHEASADEAFLATYAEAERGGALTARVIVALRVDPARGVAQVRELEALRDRHAGRLVRPVAAKVFLDGVIEGGTAALLEPYVDRPGWRGDLGLEPDTLNALVEALDDAGFKVHIHAIGDRAVRAALDALDLQHQRDRGTGPRHVVAHLQIIDPADVSRFVVLGTVASFQPLWAFRDSYVTDLTEPRLGPERSSRLYPIRSVLASGAIVAAGSDWSVTTMSPFPAIEVGVRRVDPDLDAGEAWIPEERVSLDDMLAMYTRNGALAGELGAETGTVSVGKSADLIVLDRDPYAVDARELSEIAVDVTVFEGRVVYRREGR
jgi:predicted amidohydrolase YtcJ